MRDGARNRGHAFAPLSWHDRGAAGRIRGGARGEYIAMPALLRVAAAFGLLVFVAGCGETTFQDVFGAGKDAPDETQVRTARKWVMIQAHLIALIPLAAVFMARGFGGR